MSRLPSGYCSECGKFHWSFEGYCLSRQCAGHYTEPGYPLTVPKPDVPAPTQVKGKPGKRKIKMPPKGQRRSHELWYESQGKVAPWLERPEREGM